MIVKKKTEKDGVVEIGKFEGAFDALGNVGSEEVGEVTEVDNEVISNVVNMEEVKKEKEETEAYKALLQKQAKEKKERELALKEKKKQAEKDKKKEKKVKSITKREKKEIHAQQKTIKEIHEEQRELQRRKKEEEAAIILLIATDMVAKLFELKPTEKEKVPGSEYEAFKFEEDALDEIDGVRDLGCCINIVELVKKIAELVPIELLKELTLKSFYFKKKVIRDALYNLSAEKYFGKKTYIKKEALERAKEVVAEGELVKNKLEKEATIEVVKKILALKHVEKEYKKGQDLEYKPIEILAISDKLTTLKIAKKVSVLLEEKVVDKVKAETPSEGKYKWMKKRILCAIKAVNRYTKFKIQNPSM